MSLTPEQRAAGLAAVLGEHMVGAPSFPRAPEFYVERIGEAVLGCPPRKVLVSHQWPNQVVVAHRWISPKGHRVGNWRDGQVGERDGDKDLLARGCVAVLAYGKATTP